MLITLLRKKKLFFCAQLKQILRFVILVFCKEKLPFLAQDVKFLWEKENTTFAGQTIDTLKSEVRLKIMNESCGEEENFTE